MRSSIQFLKELRQVSTELSNNSVALFFYGSYSPLFLQEVFSLIKTHNREIKYLDLHNNGIEGLQSYLSVISFTTPSFFWLGDLSELSRKDSLAIQNFLKAYQGPEWVGYFTKEKTTTTTLYNKNLWNIELKDLNIQEAYELWQLLYPSLKGAWIKEVLKILYDKNSLLSLDLLCMALRYTITLQQGSIEYFKQWATWLFTVQSPLYILAGNLFSKNIPAFFSLWYSCKDFYSEQFWIAFWSEQFFRGYWFTYYQQIKEQGEAKKISFKLPFSFIKKDYKLSTPSQLITMHKVLYRLDWQLKNGQKSGFESLFLNFMLNRLENYKDLDLFPLLTEESLR